MRLAQRLLRIECWDLVGPQPCGDAGVAGQAGEGLFAMRCGAGESGLGHEENHTSTSQTLSRGFWKFLGKVSRAVCV
jgi:hypothetical protein